MCVRVKEGGGGGVSSSLAEVFIMNPAQNEQVPLIILKIQVPPKEKAKSEREAVILKIASQKGVPVAHVHVPPQRRSGKQGRVVGKQKECSDRPRLSPYVGSPNSLHRQYQNQASLIDRHLGQATKSLRVESQNNESREWARRISSNRL